MKRRVTVYWAALALAAAARAEVVHVSTDVNGQVTTTSIETQSAFTTPSAPAVSGKIFTGWTISTDEPLASRDAMGRSLETVTATIYQDTTLTANYLPSSQDGDGDGIADGWELYWYGDLDEGAASDTDGDGFRLGAELALGMNPLIADEASAGAEIITATGGFVQYNIETTYRWVVRSEPEGALFATYSSDIAHPGDVVTTAAYSPDTSRFAYWTVDGVAQRDAMGRALDGVTVRMANHDVEIVAVCVEDANRRKAQYWYADETALDSDTDGDGFRLGAEIALEMNPLIADEASAGAEIITATGPWQEVNLQLYEKVKGAVIDGEYAEFPVLANGTQIWPVVADVNGDGLWDLTVVSETATNVFMNVGSKGNPQFAKCGSVGTDVLGGPYVDLDMNSTAKLAAMTLDVEPVNALSATTNGTTMLVSDSDGRIWLYEGTEGTTANYHLPTTNYQLLHKVWGGSYAGFANGLMLAAVDWEDDGDLDCLCGTAEGKLMLLRDPKVGRPTNLKADVGVDNVLLTWDPNEQSRIRGYKVYRAVDESPDYGLRGTPALPTYRDTGLSTGTYGYKVSALSRFYTAGNSTPTETESVATDPVSATVGGVRFFWNDVACKVGEAASVMLSIENALNYNVAGRIQVVSYDPTYLEPAELVPSGLAEGIKYTSSFADGQWTITLTEGVLPAGSGKFFTLVFHTLKAGETTVGEAKVTISSAPTYQLGDVNGDGKVDVGDLRLLAKLKSAAGRKYNSGQLRAGDFNGNGKLDNADYQSLRELLRKLGIL